MPGGEASELLKMTNDDDDNDEKAKKKRRMNKRELMKKNIGFDMRCLRRLAALVRILVSCGAQCNSVGVSVGLVVLLVLSVGQTWVVSMTGSMVGQFYQSIAESNEAMFMGALRSGTVIVSVSAVLLCLSKVCGDVLGWMWRKTLVTHIQQRYFGNLTFYKLLNLDDRVDNVDQRLTQDIDNFCTTLSLIVQQCITAPLTIVLYVFHTMRHISLATPLFVFGYFLVGAAVNKLISTPIVKMVFTQEQLEGDFRHLHGWVRNLSESIALSEGHQHEHEAARRTFAALLRNKLRLVLFQFGLNTSSQLFTYCGSVVNYVVVAIPVFWPALNGHATAAKLTVPEITSNCFYCIMLISGFSQFFNCSTLFTEIAGHTSRIATLTEVCDDLNNNQSSDKNNQSDNNSSKPKQQQQHKDDCDGTVVTINDDEKEESNNKKQQVVECCDDCIEFVHVSYFTPKPKSSNNNNNSKQTTETATEGNIRHPGCGRCLVSDLSFRMGVGDNTLVTGVSGCGKSSLVRILFGLWPFWQGLIRKPFTHHQSSSTTMMAMMYLPQRPYIAHGCSLDEQITYPDIVSHPMSHQQLHHLLSLVNLQNLLINNTNTTTTDEPSDQREDNDDGDRQHEPEEEEEEEEEPNWVNVLSQGEQQRISVLRVLWHKPRFAVLDEATSAVDPAMEATLYRLLKEAGITVLSIGHNPSLTAFHKTQIYLDGNGGWSQIALH